MMKRVVFYDGDCYTSRHGMGPGEQKTLKYGIQRMKVRSRLAADAVSEGTCI
ncbi:MAG: hypothetical protein HY552_07325 [Elusimicrobia bacterium]|nr:hypothetical protein [Elusimicrobiota bacterium]